MKKARNWTPWNPDPGRRNVQSPFQRMVALLGMMALVIPALLISAPIPLHAGLDDALEAMEMNDYPPNWEPPAIDTQTAAGGKISLSDFRGKVVLLNFWATWCVPCITEMPELQALHVQTQGKGLVVLGINVEENPSVVARFGRRLKLNFPLVLDLDGRIHRDYGVIGLPSTFLIGRDGRPVGLAVGYRDWSGKDARTLIELLLAEQPTVKVAQ